MRYSLLDYLVGPRDGQPLRVLESTVTAKCSADGWNRCRQWCGRHNSPAKEVDSDSCTLCLGEELLEGTLIAVDGIAYPVVRGIPRILSDTYLDLVPGLSSDWVARHRKNLPSEATAFEQVQIKTATGFAEEWGYFAKYLPEYEPIARSYFDLVMSEEFSGVTVDAGCGMGRWARYAGGRGQALLAADLSSAVDVAARNLSGVRNTHLIQADVHELPFRADAVDLMYSLGVLHHLPNPQEGLRRLVRHVKPGGRFLGYFYYALDNRPQFYLALLPIVNAVRRVVSGLPHSVARWMCFIFALCIYWPLIQVGAILKAVGFTNAARQVPLYEFYAGKSFRILFNDSVDRFSTAVEFRFSRKELVKLYSRSGLEETQISDSPPFWKIMGRKALSAPTAAQTPEECRAATSSRF